MNNEIVNSVINNIAEKLGIAVEYVVPALVRYNIAGCIIDIMVSIIFSILSFLTVKASKKILKINDDAYDNGNGEMSRYSHDSNKSGIIASGVIIFVICLIVAIVALLHSLSIVQWIMAPEGATIAYILDKIKS